MGAASLWSVPGGQRLRLREVGAPIDAVAFAPNGELVATADRDGAEQIWNASSGALQSQGNQLHDKLFSIEFDPTSRLVVVAGASGKLAVTEAAQSMALAILEGPKSPVLAAHFSSDGKRVVGAVGSSGMIWDAASTYRRWTTPPLSDDCGYVSSLEPDQRFVAVGCREQNTRVWDTDRDELLAELPPVTQVDGDFASAFPAVSSLGDRAAIARGNSVLVYEIPGRRLLRTITHRAAVNTVAFANGSRDLVSGAVDGSILVTWSSGGQLSIPASAGAAGVDAAALLADGRVVAADAGQRLRVYDSRGNVLADLATRTRVRTLRVSPDNRRMVTIASFLSKVASPELWDLEHYWALGVLLQANDEARVYSARFVEDEILAACSDGSVRRWDGITGRLEQRYLGAQTLIDATLSSDRSMVIAVGGDGLLRFWDADRGAQLWTMPAHRSAVVGVRVDGEDIVTRSFAGEVSRWTVSNPLKILAACRQQKQCAIVAK